MNLFKHSLTILKKDLLLELRGKESLSLMLFLSLLLLVIFNFALDIDRDNVSSLAPGILWVIFAFSGVLGMGRTSMAERDEEAWLSIFFSPASPESFYIGKAMGNLVFLLVTEIFALVFFAILFDYEQIVISLPLIFPSIFLGTLGFALVGTLFSFLSTASRYGEVLMPFLYLPVVVPVILGGVTSMGLLLNGQPEEAGKWTGILIVFDLIYLALSLILFRHIMEE